MADNIVESLFGPSPLALQMQLNSAAQQQAQQYANMTPMQRGSMSLFQAGQGLGGMLGGTHPIVQQAQQQQQALSGLDMSNPQSILAKAAVTTDPRLRIQLQLLAQQAVERQQKAALEQQKAVLADRRQTFQETEAMDLKRQQLTQMLEIAKMRSQDARYSADQRAEAAREANQIKLMLGHMTNAIAQQKVAAAGPKLTKGQEAVDRKFGGEYADYVASGGYADVVKQLDQLNQVVKDLNTEGNDYTGPAVGLIPEKARAFTNPEAVAAKNKVEEVAQRNLRQVLGAQFTQVEGERLIARAYNPSLPPKENARRVEALVKQISDAAKAKESAAKYFEENGTLTGWTGRMPSIADFDQAIDAASSKSVVNSSGINAPSMPSSIPPPGAVRRKN